MEIASVIGGIPAVTACLTIFTGIIGAVLGPYVLTLSGITSPSARGVARRFSMACLPKCWCLSCLSR